jgi:carboxyl-terminal processing protease
MEAGTVASQQATLAASIPRELTCPLTRLLFTNAYLTPSGRDIHKHGIDPDVTAKMTELEAQRLKLEDLGTKKDSQYRVAESTLVKRLRNANSVEKAYNPRSANVPAAVAPQDSSAP